MEKRSTKLLPLLNYWVVVHALDLLIVHENDKIIMLVTPHNAPLLKVFFTHLLFPFRKPLFQLCGVCLLRCSARFYLLLHSADNIMSLLKVLCIL